MIIDGNVGDVFDGFDISEEEYEVVFIEECFVIVKEIVLVECVCIGIEMKIDIE